MTSSRLELQLIGRNELVVSCVIEYTFFSNSFRELPLNEKKLESEKYNISVININVVSCCPSYIELLGKVGKR